MSADLVWSIVRNNSCYLVKRDGAQFSREPGNVMNLNTYKYSGLANTKTVAIEKDEKENPVLTIRTKKGRNKPERMDRKVVLRVGARGTKKYNDKIKAEVCTNFYRPDLTKQTLARLTAETRAARKKKAGVTPKFKPKRPIQRS